MLENLPFAIEPSEKQDFEPMYSTRGETIISSTVGQGTARKRRRIETDSNFLLHHIEQKETEERPLNVRNNRMF